MSDTLTYSIYEMEINQIQGEFYQIVIKNGTRFCEILYNPKVKELQFRDKNELSNELKANCYQLRKILHNKKSNTYFIGFKLKFILRNNENAIALNDLTKLVVLDRRKGEFNVSSQEKEEKQILKIYTDGCYLEKKKRGAYIALIQKPNGLLNLYFSGTKAQSSSLIELMAVIEGLKHIGKTDSIRIIADSRYVIKGFTEWIFNWKLNDWHTAQGEKVKNIEYWKEFDHLTEDKYIEFEWVKGHSNHYFNSICDFYAKQAATRI